MNLDTALVEILPALRRYALFLSGNTHEADDLVNDCALRVLTAKASFDRSRSIRPWAFQILRNLYLDLRRKGKGHVHFPIEEVASVADEATSQKITDTIELKQTLSAILTLPSVSREVLILVAVEGFSYKEAAECLDLPLGTVMSRLARARKQLAELLDDANNGTNPSGISK